MTDSNGVKPSNEELLRLLAECAECESDDLMWLKPELVVYLARAELQRRQQPAGEAASVPAELVQQWYNEWALTVQSGELCKDLAQHIADCTAAAYGREQLQCRTAAVVDELSNFIRLIDGNNSMGAGELAQRIAEWFASGQPILIQSKHKEPPTAGQCCPMCGSPEVDHYGPATKYACGSSDYDQRPGTFRESERCNHIRLRIPLQPEPPTC